MFKRVAAFILGMVLVAGSLTRLFGFDPMDWFQEETVPIWVAVLIFGVGLSLMFPKRTAVIYGMVKDRLPSFGQK